MAQPKPSPGVVPDYNLHRDASGNDTLPIGDRGKGMHMHGYSHAHVQVIPTGGDNPVVSVLFWSETAGEFIVQHTALDFGAKGANVSWEATIEARGRVMFVALTAGVAAGTKVFVSGFDVHRM